MTRLSCLSYKYSEAILLYNKSTPGLEVIKLEYSFRLKIKRNDGLLSIIAIYFESENELKFYNPEA